MLGKRHLSLLLVCVLAPLGRADEPERPPADKEPVLRIDAGGPGAYVTALAFSADGQTLYAGGWDKVVRSWTRDARGVFQPGGVFRVPVAPGIDGAINAIALSSDGVWLAAAGTGATRSLAGFRQTGFLVPAAGALDETMRRDVGTIYLFNLRDRSARILRGHEGHIVSLAFATHRDRGPLLLSVAEELGSTSKLEKQLVARLWDVNRGKSLAQRRGLPRGPKDTSRPGVALWQTDADDGDVQAALAVQDSRLSIWKPDEDRMLRFADLRYSMSLAHVPGSDRVLTAGFDDRQQKSLLALWQVAADGKARRLGTADVGPGFPRALTLLSRGGDGSADLAAAVLWEKRPEGQLQSYHLRIVARKDNALGEVVASTLLWEEYAGRQPAIAASLRGRHLAVAGSGDRAIRIYAIADLLEKKDAAPQVLAGNGDAFAHVSFVRKGEELGLLLNRKLRKQPGAEPPAPDADKGDLIFDVARRRLTDATAGWEAARPPRDGWRAQPGKDNTITVYQDEEQIKKIQLDYEIVDHAILPPGKLGRVPLLAIAGHHNGQPRLAIYNARSGEQLRELTGHKDRLRSLAFSPDGRLLVSTADDGLVCVWSLTSLPRILGKHGRLPGITVGPAQGGVEVLKVEEDSPARDDLTRGDRIAGLVIDGKLRRTASPRDFYESFYLLEPGKDAVLRRTAPRPDDITVRVGQGIDEHKPLFSLFINRADRVVDREWIGWSPIGPYESSSPRADRHLVWHFNTGEPGRPTRSASADKYRKEHYRKGLLGELIQRGELGQGGPDPLPLPRIQLWLVQGQEALLPQGQAPILARIPRVTARVAVQGRPLTALAKLTWRLDDDIDRPLDLNQPDAPFLLPLTLSRGEHRLVVTAQAPDLPDRAIRESLRLRYLPSPPQVRGPDRDRQLFVRDAAFTLHADVIPGVPGEEVRIRLRHHHADKELHASSHTLSTPSGKEAIPFEHRLRLQPGNNLVEIIATNRDARDEDQEAETGRMTLQVYSIQKARPPQITFGEVLPGQEGGKAVAVDPSQPVVVQTPVVRLAGSIQADEVLAEAVRDDGSAARAASLDGFQPGKQARITFRERLTLEPGTQIVRVRARTTTSDEAEYRLALTYQPPVPLATLTVPQDGGLFRGTDDTLSVTVRGRLQLFPEAQKYQVALLLGGKPAAAPTIDPETGMFSGKVTLRPGDNRLQAVVRNRWGAVRSSDEVLLRYVRPPIMARLSCTSVPGRPLLDLQAEVISPVAPLAGSVRIEVNGRQTSAREIRIRPGKDRHWTVLLPGVPLIAGSRQQVIEVRLSSAETACQAPGRLTVKSEAELSPPIVELLEPGQDGAVSDPHVILRFRVRSAEMLERVRLLHEGRPDQVINLTRTIRTASGGYELTVAQHVELVRGFNRLSVEAVSVSGCAPDAPARILNYVPPPLRVAIDRITLLGADGEKPLEPVWNPRKELVFPRVAAGQVRLHGRILWADPVPKQGEHVLVRVFVNGFQQLPRHLQRGATDEMETPFVAPLMLNRERNRIQLVIPRPDSSDPAECLVDCSEPISRQRLHVLALGPRARSERARAQILRAIGSRRAGEGMQAPAFDEVFVATPRTEARVDRYYLCSQLLVLRDRIRDRQLLSLQQGSTPSNDVMMLYYEGQEAVNEKGNFFELEAAAQTTDPFGMPCDELVDLLTDIPGAHILLLDVARAQRPTADQPGDKIVHWKDDYPDAGVHVIVLRCAGARDADRGRLIPVLQQAIPQERRMSRIIALARKVLETSTQTDPLLFTSYLPTELADLMVGRP